MKLPLLHPRTFIALAGIAICGAVDAQKYESHDGCDEGRTKEWESIIIGFEGDPVEQADARSVRDENLRLCAEWKAGRQTSPEIEQQYDAAMKAWLKRFEQRKKSRLMPAGSEAAG